MSDVGDRAGRIPARRSRSAALAGLSARARRFASTSVSAPVAAGASLFLAFFLCVPPPETLTASYSRAIYSADGELLGASVSGEGQWHFPSGSPVDGKFERAVTVFEDARFRSHPGFDVLAIVRAVRDNLASGSVVSGASTITMQAIRSSRRGERTVWEKLVELWFAVRLELGATKDRILARYVADAPFGGNVVGVEAASFRYLGRAPETMSWAEAATLAVLPNSPALIHLGRARDELRAKRDRLLARLHSSRDIDADELDAALREPLPDEPYPMPRLAPHLLARATRDLPDKPRVVTTLDATVQESVTRALDRSVRRLADLGVANAACVVVRVSDGAIVAYAGNLPRSSLADPVAAALDVDCAAAPRSSGSALKPFLYAAMVDSGELLPRQLVADIPTRFGGFSPENNSGDYWGAVPADEALSRSLNIPFVRLLASYGVDRFRRTLISLGFTTVWREADDYGLTLVIGGAETNLLELAGAYASMARSCRGGEQGSTAFMPWYCADAEFGNGGPPRGGDSGPLPFSRAAAWLTFEALLGTARPAEDAAWTEFASGRKIGWKTGTSFGYRDSWAVGANGEYVVAAWAGNANGQGRPELYGSTGAAPVMFSVFESLPRASWFAVPADSLKSVETCAASGHVASPWCADRRTTLVPAAMAVRGVCPYCAPWLVSADGAWRVDADSAEKYGARLVPLFSLPPTMEWYFRRKEISYRPLPPFAPDSRSSSRPAFDVVMPSEGMAVYAPVELDGSPGEVVFEATCRDPGLVLHWHLDSTYLGSTRGFHQIAVRPGQGAHVLTVVDSTGASVSVRFVALNER